MEGNNVANRRVFGENIERLIPKATWTSPNLESAFAKQTSSFGASCKKEQKKEIDPNGMPKTQMPSKGQQKLVRGEKPRDKLEGDQVEHL